jgi:hypothetical protein
MPRHRPEAPPLPDRFQNALAAIKLRGRFAQQALRSTQELDLLQAARLFLASSLAQAITGFDTKPLKQFLASKPESCLCLATTLRRLFRDSLAAQKYRCFVKPKPLPPPSRSKSKKISPEGLAEMKAALDKI